MIIKFLQKLFNQKQSKLRSFVEEGAVILDVRNQDEYDADHLDKAVLIPLPELQNNLEEIKNWNKPVIVYCRSGRRSGSAAKILNKHNINAVNGGGLQDMKKLFS